mgnify:CR=1 FL=1
MTNKYNTKYIMSYYSYLLETNKEYTEKLRAKKAQQLKTMALKRLPQTSTSSGLFAFFGSVLLMLGVVLLNKKRVTL